jgi:hypothetical protein
MRMQTSLQTRNRAALAVKLLVVLLFLLGVGIIFNGVQAMRLYKQSGFSSESAYQAIYHLSKETDSAWDETLLPGLKALSDEDRQRVDDVTAALLSSTWEKQKKGGGEALEEFVLRVEFGLQGLEL